MKEYHQVAFIGVGLMGKPMVANLIEAGYQLRLWNRTREKANFFAGRAFIAETAHAAVKGATIIITMLENGSVVDDVLYQSGAINEASEGSIVIDMSSISPKLAKVHAHLCKERGVGYLDAPVSGGTVGAAARTLSIMAGGETREFNRCKDVLEVLGRPIHIGPVGTGQVAKLANQAIVGITIGAVSEALLLAAKSGADPAAVREALLGGFAGSKILELHGQRMLDRNFIPGATARVQLKDLRTILDEAEDNGLQLPLSQCVYKEYEALVAAGHENVDHSGLLLHIEALNEFMLDAGAVLKN
ncbi:MAG: NAD(P)-dependent oxidoreductase [Hahellaceae bacterium]|nr:NAD(P)-dependent oxidoreductase [Hahellaceae bacterium]MCP5210221.1 NAD(P)-dependent oxidoreductase [Hahellaceae bacterium]